MSCIQFFIVDRHFGFCKKIYTPLKNHLMNSFTPKFSKSDD